MRPFLENDIKQEIHHIFESGANETRVFELVRSLLARESDEFPDPEDLKSFEDWAKREEGFVPKSQLTPDQFISEAKLAFKELCEIHRSSYKFVEPNENYLDTDSFAESMEEKFFLNGKNEFWRLLDCEIISE